MKTPCLQTLLLLKKNKKLNSEPWTGEHKVHLAKMPSFDLLITKDPLCLDFSSMSND